MEAPLGRSGTNGSNGKGRGGDSIWGYGATGAPFWSGKAGEVETMEAWYVSEGLFIKAQGASSKDEAAHTTATSPLRKNRHERGHEALQNEKTPSPLGRSIRVLIIAHSQKRLPPSVDLLPPDLQPLVSTAYPFARKTPTKAVRMELQDHSPWELET